ncbi:MAG: type II secretion system protein GspJ, partial [Planctomycetota bacterium]
MNTTRLTSRRAPSRPGFTLVELIVTVMVGAIVAGAATAAMSTFLRGRSRAQSHFEANRRADIAVDRIATDVANTVRDRDLIATTLLVTDAKSGALDADSILIFARSMRPTRVGTDEPEGEEAEVQYKLFPSPDGRSSSLWRRSDPVPDEASDAGGVAALVVEGVTSLSIRSMDQANWYDDWDTDASGYPHAVMIQVTATSDDQKTTAIARRVIALDRTPLPGTVTDVTTAPATTTPAATTPTTPAPAAAPAAPAGGPIIRNQPQPGGGGGAGGRGGGGGGGRGPGGRGGGGGPGGGGNNGGGRGGGG